MATSAAAAAAVPEDAPEGGLTDREREILEFETGWWRFGGAKEAAISEVFGLNATRYYQILNALIDRPEALAAQPLLVKRLRRMRSSRQQARSARRLADITA
ncbi:DUF3263 domain-containing protein [Salana multivorans]